MIKAAGYKWRKARIVLTSTDPTYREKLDRIWSILSHLQPDEAFFSIDEYGPFAIKTKPGRVLVSPDVHPTVPQWQKSRGCFDHDGGVGVIWQSGHAFLQRKEEHWRNDSPDGRSGQSLHRSRKLYLSWDVASWHISKQRFARIEAHNSAVVDGGGPLVETAPLPAGAQFLSVIEFGLQRHGTCDHPVRRIDSSGPQRITLGAMRPSRPQKLRFQKSSFCGPAR